MRTIKKVCITPVYVEFAPEREQMKEGEIYISKKYGSTLHNCLCGCSELVVLPINNIINGVDYGWKLIEENQKISFTPSVGNYQLPCKSHYVITKNVANFL
tara:strand:+ start:362 stop:664 length:303 start_codon:yes stop_codon:yes gene_type:complete